MLPIFLRPYNKYKMQLRLCPCVCLGYSHTHLGNRCLNLHIHKIILARYVEFHETHFPFKNTSNTNPTNKQPVHSYTLQKDKSTSFKLENSNSHLFASNSENTVLSQGNANSSLLRSSAGTSSHPPIATHGCSSHGLILFIDLTQFSDKSGPPQPQRTHPMQLRHVTRPPNPTALNTT